MWTELDVLGATENTTPCTPSLSDRPWSATCTRAFAVGASAALELTLTALVSPTWTGLSPAFACTANPVGCLGSAGAVDIVTSVSDATGHDGAGSGFDTAFSGAGAGAGFAFCTGTLGIFCSPVNDQV